MPAAPKLTVPDVKNRMLVRDALQRMQTAAETLRGKDLEFAAKELQDAAAGTEKLASASPALTKKERTK